jgi:transposase
LPCAVAICSALNFSDEENEMADEHRPCQRYGEAFWRAHHEAWKRSDLNQRQYCEAQGIPLKAFGNWRARFKAEPQPAVRKLLYRRGGLSHTLRHSLSHPFSHPLSHGTYPSSLPPAPIVPPAREGHRRRFSDADKRRILEEAAQPDASVAQIARRYGIARRVLCRWKQELAPPLFVAVQITDADAPFGTAAAEEEHVL